MGLVNCPECGREDVSDQAVQCPKCGYPVGAYFLAIEMKRKREEAAKKKAEDALKEKERVEACIAKAVEKRKHIGSEICSRCGGSGTVMDFDYLSRQIGRAHV